MSDYTIQKGDTLSGIAKANNTSVRALMQQNPQIADPDAIRAGDTMRVPDAPPPAPPANQQAALAQGEQAEGEMCTDGAPADEAVCATCPCQQASNPLETPADEDPLAEPEAQPDPMDETEFGKSFEQRTGMKLSESIAQYEADTGKTLDPATVETLFTDPAGAKQLLMDDETLHRNYRDILNTNIPATEQDARNQGYTEPTFLGSTYLGAWFHDPGNNVKLVSPDGHREAVFNRNTGALDNSLDYKGTFNFFGPDQKGNHKAADVDPYNKWGN